MNIACFLQAYTVELETEVTLLKEENAKLKQQQVSLILQKDLYFYLYNNNLEILDACGLSFYAIILFLITMVIFVSVCSICASTCIYLYEYMHCVCIYMNVCMCVCICILHIDVMYLHFI